MNRNYRNGWQSEARRAAYVANIVSAPSRFDAPVYPLGVFLAAVAEVIRTRGFLKEMCAADAFQLVVANKDNEHEFAVEDWVTAAEAVAWMLGKDARPGFEADLQAAVACTDIPQNKMRLVMYVVKMYVENKAKVEALPDGLKDSQHVGSLKERLTLSVNVFESNYVSSEWGDSYRTKGMTPEGNIVMWFAKEQVAFGPCTIKGTVAKHNNYNGVNETYLNRVAVL